MGYRAAAHTPRASRLRRVVVRPKKRVRAQHRKMVGDKSETEYEALVILVALDGARFSSAAVDVDVLVLTLLVFNLLDSCSWSGITDTVL